MNDQTTIDRGGALALPDAPKLLDLYRDGEIDQILDRIETEAMAIAPDLSTAKGRKEIASLAHKVARSKTALDDAGKKLTEDARRQIDAVNAERKKVRDRLDALKGQVRQPLVDWEAAEEARKQGHRDRLALFRLDRSDWQMASDEIATIIDEIEAIDIDSSWDEFETMAEEAKAEAWSKFRADLRAAKAREDQAAELERLRKAEAEREAKERAEAKEREREEARRRAQEEKRVREKAEAKRLMEHIAECREGRIDGERQSYSVIIYDLVTNVPEAMKAISEEDAEAVEALRLASLDHVRHMLQAEQAEEQRKAEEERRQAEAEAREKALAEEQERQARAAEEERKAREKREKNRRHRAKIKREIRASIDGMDLDQVADALMEGKVTHCVVEI